MPVEVLAPALEIATSQTPDERAAENHATQITRHKFTVDDYYHMHEAGILRETDRVELIDGEIRKMDPIDALHAEMVNRLNYVFSRWVDEQVIVRVQNPIRLHDYTETARSDASALAR